MSNIGVLLLSVAAASGLACAVLGSVASRPTLARLASGVTAAALVAATVRLVWAVATLDFSFTYVTEQTRDGSSLGYRVAALWGGAEGSLLFFVALLGVCFVWTVVRRHIGRRGLVLGALVNLSLTITVLAFANPFESASLPAVRGAGLTPILEHPAMLYHPPILYVGLVATFGAFLVVFDDPSRALGDRLHVVRRSTTVAWTFLVAGLATGANWAYVEVGWGGYWAWDPVENTVLMPWLLLTAGLHTLRSPNLWQRFPRGVLALFAAPFVFVLFGAAVTRSGGLSSVHAFAEARALGWSLGLITVGAVLAMTLRLMPAGAVAPALGSRSHDRLIGLSIAIALFSVAFVLLGVGVPLLPGFNRVVTADYYNRIGVPVLIAVLGALTMMATPPKRPLVPARETVLMAAGAMAGVVIAIAVGTDRWFVLVVAALGGAVLVSHGLAWRRIRVASLVAHLGFVVFAVGAVASANAQVDRTVLEPGDSMSIGTGAELVYDSFIVSDGPRPNSEAVTMHASIVDSSSRRTITRITPGLVNYPNRGVVLAETALYSTPQRDIQVVVTTLTNDGLAAVSVSERPGQMLVWWGAAIITIAGLVALVEARRRGPELRQRSRLPRVSAAFSGEQGVEG